jgi:very-short-patch-repair endonuclease
MENHHYNRNLKYLARQLRSNSTKAEVKLWNELLKAKQLRGYGFLRQRPVDNYIADFMCKELNLIIEVDGISHEGKEKEDALRDEVLSELGFGILRFTDQDVLEDLNYVEDTIISWIKNQKK